MEFIFYHKFFNHFGAEIANFYNKWVQRSQKPSGAISEDVLHINIYYYINKEILHLLQVKEIASHPRKATILNKMFTLYY